MIEIPSYGYALMSALAWAVSAQLINKGLQQLPRHDKFPALIGGLMISLSAGSLLLGVIVFDSLSISDLRWELIAAGILTFPLGTGLYYFCGHAVGGRMEFASQFANVKPIFSVVFGFVFLSESLSAQTLIGMALIFCGVGVLCWGSVKGDFSWFSLGLGIALASAWAGGETFIKVGLEGKATSLDATFISLASGTVVGLALGAPYVISQKQKLPHGGKWVLPFVGHGILSFTLAYSALFESIRRIGLIDSILITAFWPALALLLGRVCGTRSNQQISPLLILAMLLLVSGSLIHVGVVARINE